jgi:hypothetical protein
MMLVDVIQALEDDPGPPETVEVLAAADARLHLSQW